jgi:hypothetical protein
LPVKTGFYGAVGFRVGDATEPFNTVKSCQIDGRATDQQCFKPLSAPLRHTVMHQSSQRHTARSIIGRYLDPDDIKWNRFAIHTLYALAKRAHIKSSHSRDGRPSGA